MRALIGQGAGAAAVIADVESGRRELSGNLTRRLEGGGKHRRHGTQTQGKAREVANRLAVIGQICIAKSVCAEPVEPVKDEGDCGIFGAPQNPEDACADGKRAAGGALCQTCKGEQQ